jgi:two-component system, OmpR family, copper resistance phosphate regulon response regulator CusR
MRALVIEDEPKTATFLRDGLRDQGWHVDVVGDGDRGLREAVTRVHDLLLLDVRLPGLDGWSVLIRARSEGVTAPVIFLTAQDRVEDRVRGLDLGADDYLVKPFALSELLARIRSIRRRGPESARIQVAGLELDLVNRGVSREGQCVELTPKEFALLALLARNAGEILGRRFLAREVWGMEDEGESNLVDVAIRRLRRKIDQPFGKPLIHSVYGAGYILQAR